MTQCLLSRGLSAHTLLVSFSLNIIFLLSTIYNFCMKTFPGKALRSVTFRGRVKRYGEIIDVWVGRFAIFVLLWPFSIIRQIPDWLFHKSFYGRDLATWWEITWLKYIMPWNYRHKAEVLAGKEWDRLFRLLQGVLQLYGIIYTWQVHHRDLV